MGFALGSFSGGLLGGATSMMQLYGMYQQSEITGAAIEGAKKLGEAKTEQDAADKAGDGAIPMDLTRQNDGGGILQPSEQTHDPGLLRPQSALPTAGGGGGMDPTLRARMQTLADAPQPPVDNSDAQRALAARSATRAPPVADTTTYGGSATLADGSQGGPYGPTPVPYTPQTAAAPELGPDGKPKIAAGDFSSWSARALEKYGPKLAAAGGTPAAPTDPNAPATPAISPTTAGATPTPTPETPPDTTTTSALPTPPIPPASAPAQAPAPPTPTALGDPQMATPAPAPAPAAPAPIGSHILSSLNPISSANAAETGKPAGTPVPADTPLGPVPAGGTSSAGAANPKQVSALQTSQVPNPMAGETAVNVPATVAPVTRNQTSPTVQSEATPHLIKPAIDVQYYQSLAPKYRSLVDKIAAEEDVSPERLAGHWYAESRLRSTSPNSASGAVGIMQVLPSTRDMVDPRHELDQTTVEGSLRTGARYINQLDRSPLGRDTRASVVAYFGGPGTAHAFASNFDQASKDNPKSLAYMRMLSGDAPLNKSQFAVAEASDPRALVQAASQGPDQFVHYLASTGTKGAQMSDKWREAETSLIVAAAMKGDYAGVAHARDLVLQMSQSGMSQYTQKADQALAAGDAQGAAQYLAKAHTFFPDGTMGQFGVDASGKLWAQRVDEHDPSRKLGSPFEVTRQGLQATMNQTRDPHAYVKMVNEQQTVASKLRLDLAHEQYYKDMPAARVQAAQIAGGVRADAAAGRQQTADLAEQGRNERAQIAAEARAAQAKAAGAARLEHAVGTEIDERWGAKSPDGAMTSTPQTSAASQVYHSLRTSEDGVQPTKMTAPHATYITQGLIAGTMSIKPASNGQVAISDPKDPHGRVLAYLEPDTVRQFMKPGQAGAITPATPAPNAPSSTTTH